MTERPNNSQARRRAGPGHWVPPGGRLLLGILLLLMLISLLFPHFPRARAPAVEISYSQFKSLVRAGEVKDVMINEGASLRK